VTTFRPRPRPASLSSTRRAPEAWVDGWAWTLRVAAIAALFGAEMIHVAVMNAHFTEWVGAGVFFLVISVIEGLLAAGLLVVPSRRLCLVAAAMSLATVAVWAVSRTTGLPFGPAAGVPERIGRADSVSTLFEIGTAVWLLMISRTETARPARASRVRATAAVAVVAVIALMTAAAVRTAAEPSGHVGHSVARSFVSLSRSCAPPNPCS